MEMVKFTHCSSFSHLQVAKQPDIADMQSARWFCKNTLFLKQKASQWRIIDLNLILKCTVHPCHIYVEK